MRKALIVGIALSLVLVSGALFSAQAGCFDWLNPCNWHAPTLCPSASAAVESAPPKAVESSHCGCFSWLNPCNWHFCPCK